MSTSLMGHRRRFLVGMARGKLRGGSIHRQYGTFAVLQQACGERAAQHIRSRPNGRLRGHDQIGVRAFRKAADRICMLIA
jgi:hypothetical protein